MSELIVLTCASGKQCSYIIPLLSEQSSRYRLRLVVHSDKSLERLRTQYPEAEVVKANLNIPTECSQIVQGATALYYISPTFQPHEVQYGTNMIDAALAERDKPESKFTHFIFSSVLHPIIRKMLNHDRKRYIEEYLVESGLSYTILQPSHFADNMIGRLVAQKDSQTPVATVAYDPSVQFSFSVLCDYAEVSVKVISERSKHYFATYQIVSTWPMKYTEYIDSVGDALGVKFEISQLSYEEAVDFTCKLLFGTPARETHNQYSDGPERLLLYYNKRGLIANPGVTEWLLGRPATSPAALARLIAETG